jgi:diguanylate cyclase (GGDEF)-like protein
MDIRSSVNDLNETNTKLHHVSIHDALTGLYNRACFDAALHNLGKCTNVPVGIIVCDVDGLKIINDTLGHQAGDEIIRAAAHALTKGVRGLDAVARIGGDEFAILLPGAERDTLEAVCSRIKEAAKLHNTQKPDLPLYISFGYAIRYQPNFNTDEFFREADDFMYREKEVQRQAVREKIHAAIEMSGIADAGLRESG